jgi:hypothetical protein
VLRGFSSPTSARRFFLVARDAARRMLRLQPLLTATRK